MPDEILHKTGRLDEDERTFVSRHTAVGQRILTATPTLVSVASLVRSTNERWDGTGYPDGLAGDAIPLAARVIAATKAFVAMTSERPYRIALSPADALVEVRRVSGSQLDPAVVEALEDVVAAAAAA